MIAPPVPRPNALRYAIDDPDSCDRRLLHDLLATDPRLLLVDQVHTELPVDIVFADVRNWSGTIDVAHAKVTIAVSALPADAVVAFDAGAVDFVLKPFARVRVIRALERARARLAELGQLSEREGDVSVPGMSAADQSAMLPRAFVRSLRGTSPEFARSLAANDVHAVLSDMRGTRVITSHADIQSNASIPQIEQMLEASSFVRTHRTAIVNIACIRAITRVGERQASIRLANGYAVPVAKRKLRIVQAIVRVAALRAISA